jgi:hypothetical protein
VESRCANCLCSRSRAFGLERECLGAFVIPPFSVATRFAHRAGRLALKVVQNLELVQHERNTNYLLPYG